MTTPGSSLLPPITPRPTPRRFITLSRKPFCAAVCRASSTPTRASPSSTPTATWSAPNWECACSTAKPYHSWSKGKCERLIQSIQQGFETTLRLEGNAAHSLEELNTKLSAWIQTVYHQRAHSSTGQSPEYRYQQAAQSLRHMG